MSLDLLSPLPGGTTLAAVLYIGASLYVTGPLVGDRTIARSDWSTLCPELQRAELKRSEAPPAFVPKLDCRSVLGWFGSQGRDVCDQHGNPAFDVPGLNELEAHRQRLRDFQQEQLEQRLVHGGRCDCAVTLTLERHRTSLALYAGTARLVTPAAIRNLSAELQTSLSLPLCAPAASNDRGAP